MAWVKVSMKYLFTTGEGRLVIVVGSVDIVMFLLDLERVFFKGDIMRSDCWDCILL